MQLERALELFEPDLIFHAAANFGRWSGEAFYDTLWRTNVVGTKNLIRLQEEMRFRMVFFSSSEVYGDWTATMCEDVMDAYEVKQLNDYAMTKWVSEMQVLNSAAQFGTKTVRVRLFNCFGPGEYYSPYRSVACRFIYYALKGIPYTVYLDHHRTSTYITDACRTLANIADNFIPGRVYNIGGTEYHDIKQLSDMILEYVGKDDTLVMYRESEPFTTRDKKVDVSRAVAELGHECRVPLAEGIPLTVDWMRSVYK